jgi:solute carrier family 35 protein E3
MAVSKETLRVFFSLALNVISSVGVIFINKRLVFNAAGFHFGTALTVLHFLITAVGCYTFAKTGFFELKKLPWSKVLSISLAFCGYVVFNNLSLLTNSVSVYQISKILCTPVIVAVEWFYYGKKQSRATVLSLLPVCIGIAIAVYSDSSLNWVGSFWCVLAIISNSFYTIWGKTKQDELKCNALQILSYQAPMSAVMLLFFIPVADDLAALQAFKMTSRAAAYIGLSALFAFGVNFSFFLFVGQTSPLTMNVLGYLKTCLVFIGGFLFFDVTPTVQNVVGISLTMLGVALYSKAKMAPAPQAAGPFVSLPPVSIGASDKYAAPTPADAGSRTPVIVSEPLPTFGHKSTQRAV